nr:DNA-primase RepB domain-containing protein [Ruegeria sp. HKCCC2117]
MPKNGKLKVHPWPEVKCADRGISSAFTHYSVSVFTRLDGQFRRRGVQWQATKVIGLDDVGEVKEGLGQIQRPDLQPTAIIRTKPGSEQWLYVLEDYCFDANLIETIMNSAAHALITDPGVKDRTRVLRLPGVKPPGKRHAAELVFADWGRRFDPETLIDQWGIERVPRVAQRRYGTGEPVLKGDHVFAFLMERGMIRDSGLYARPEGWYEILCPWVDEHTNGDETGTYYRVPLTDEPARAFMCFHGHCRHRNSADFKSRLREMGCAPFFVVGEGISRDTLTDVSTIKRNLRKAIR